MKRKNLVKTITSLTLILCMLISTVAVAAVSVGAASATYISEIRTACATSIDAAKKILTDEGYTVLHHDMNNKVPNQNYWIYLGYKTTTNPAEAITGMVFSHEKNDTLYFNERNYNIEKGKSNFNEGAGGQNLYLYYTKESAKSYTTEYITALDVLASTDECTLKNKAYKAVGSVTNNYTVNANEGVDGAKPAYIVYQSILDPDAYKKLGVNELTQTVKAVDGVTYYDSGDNTASLNFYKTALGTEYNGTSQIELWADVLYSMLEIKGQNNGYRNDTGNSFDQMYGKGDYIDIVSSLKNGTGNYASDFWNLNIQSTGVKLAKTPQDVYNEVIGMFTSLKHGNVGIGCSDYNYSNIEEEVVDLDELKNAASSSEVVYSICRVADDNLNGSESTGHDKSTSVFGLMFYNFELVPLIEDGNTGTNLLNYAEAYDNVKSEASSMQIAVNNTENAVDSSISYTSTLVHSSSNSHSETSGKDISFTQGISTSVGSGDCLPIEVGVEVSLGWSEAFNFSESNSTENLISKEISETDTISMPIAPYSTVTLKQESSTKEQRKSYDCPMGITYDVALFSTSAELGKENMFYTSFAYNSSLYATFGDDTTNAVQVLRNIMKTNGEINKGFSVKCVGGDDHEVIFSGYSKEDWNNIMNNHVSSGEYPINTIEAMNRIVSCQPMSFNGGTIKTTFSNVSYDICNYYSLYPLDKIKVFKTNFASDSSSYVSLIELNENKEYRLQDYYSNIIGYNVYNTEFTNWDATQGYWVLVKEDGTEIKITDTPVSDGTVSARKDKVTGNIYITPLNEGSSYVRYVINETGYFQYYDYKTGDSVTFDSSKVKDCTNADITSKGTIELKCCI